MKDINNKKNVQKANKRSQNTPMTDSSVTGRANTEMKSESSAKNSKNNNMQNKKS